MKKLIFSLSVLFLTSCKKGVLSPDLTKPFSILSTSNGARNNIKVALPPDSSPETQKYTAIYVLDGEEKFKSYFNNFLYK